MLGSLINTSPDASVWKPFYRRYSIKGDCENVGSGITVAVGTNFSPNVLPYSADSESHYFQCVVRNYLAGQKLTLRAYFYCTVTTGDKTWAANFAAITVGDAQSVLTKAFGTTVTSAATPPNATLNGLYSVDFVFDTSGKLNSLENGDFLMIRLAQSAHTGTDGIAYIMGLELFSGS
jgi:hypothetical protein